VTDPGAIPPEGPHSAEASEERAPESSIYWGPWQSFILSAIVLLGAEVAGALAIQAALLLAPYLPRIADAPFDIRPLFGSAGFLTLQGLARLPVCVLLVWLFIRMRTPQVVRYLGLRLPPLPRLGRWAAYALALAALIDVFRLAVGRPIVNEWMEELWRGAPSLPLLVFVVAFAGPLYEELLFRGFLLPGFARSRIGEAGAVVLTAALFAILHLQYDWFDVLNVLVLGIFLGFARLRTGSLTAAALLHVLLNTVALAQTALAVGVGG
jgi:membrane protease YdiL (CAAX protease family)